MKYALMVRNDDLSKKTALKIKESLQNFFIYDEKNPDVVTVIEKLVDKCRIAEILLFQLEEMELF